MDLSDEQKAQVKDWVAAGESLSAVQERLDEEFGIKITYMETRFLVEDLEVELQDQESGTHKDEAAEATSDAVGAASEGVVDLEDAGFDAAAGAGQVRVEVDDLTRPGSVVSGSVTFSDGERSLWMLDQMGRLQLQPSSESYQPSEEDVQAFQAALENELRRKGF